MEISVWQFHALIIRWLFCLSFHSTNTGKTSKGYKFNRAKRYIVAINLAIFKTFDSRSLIECAAIIELCRSRNSACSHFLPDVLAPYMCNCACFVIGTQNLSLHTHCAFGNNFFHVYCTIFFQNCDRHSTFRIKRVYIAMHHYNFSPTHLPCMPPFPAADSDIRTYSYVLVNFECMWGHVRYTCTHYCLGDTRPGQ